MLIVSRLIIKMVVDLGARWTEVLFVRRVESFLIIYSTCVYISTMVSSLSIMPYFIQRERSTTREAKCTNESLNGLDSNAPTTASIAISA